ncbi:Hpt domain-containing protein [Solimonas sp. SE-A11]|uniref:Hpt domain-containing protein n=1 Tax=Solimonas sp. SE-A11 TaxID=3054954 RepID=UPI00259CF836|nr:Hpt domain-containing protein [Solimonas sp. SE-A11]MDM4772160.1 Hpt domain-containing protein [Solimonas sp. SE-A11]
MNTEAGNTPTDCLIVDADPVSRRLAGLLLARLGYPSPALAETVQEAPATLQGLVLAGTDDRAEGIATLRSRIDPARRARTRLVAVLAAPSEEARQACLRAGADAVLAKPLALAELAALLAPAAKAGDFNAEAWAELLEMFGADGAAQLVAALIDDLPVQQQRMADALRDQDLIALKRIAHALRGVSLQLGAESLAELCTQTEAAAAAGQASVATELGARLIGRHEALAERLRHETARR